LKFDGHHVTGIAYDGRDIIANYSGYTAFLFRKDKTKCVPIESDGKKSRLPKVESSESDLPPCDGTWERAYQGHSNQLTVKEISFLGWHNEYISTGSDDGRVFIWEKETEKVSNIILTSYVTVLKPFSGRSILQRRSECGELRARKTYRFDDCHQWD
jgi:WD40 repeat protein